MRGTILGQGIIVLSLPWISRLYEPEAFGVIQSLQSILTILLIVSSLRFELGILTARDFEVSHIVFLAILFCTIVSVFTAILLILVEWRFPEVLADLYPAIFLLPVALFFSGIGQILNYLGLRAKILKPTADAKILQSVIYAVAAIIFGIYNSSVFALNLADVIGRGAMALILLKALLNQVFFKIKFLSKETVAIFYKFIDLPKISLPSAIINTLGSSFTTLIMLSIFNSYEAGNYAVIERFVAMPIGVVGGVASQAFIVTLSDTEKEYDVKRNLFLKIIIYGIFFGILPMFILMIYGEKIVPIVLGAEWELAGSYLSILAPFLFISAIATPVNMTLVLCGELKWQLIWDSLRLVVVMVMWSAVSSWSISAHHALILYSIVSSIFYFIHILLSYRAIYNRYGNKVS